MYNKILIAVISDPFLRLTTPEHDLTNMLTRFHLIPERDGQTGGWTDRQTDGLTELLIAVSISARHYADAR